MRSMSIVIAVTIFLFPTVCLAQNEAYDDCKANCAADRATRDMDCPSVADSADNPGQRDQCLQASRDLYQACLDNCPGRTPPAESSPAPMSY